MEAVALSESRLLQVDYAKVDCFFSLGLVIYLLTTKRTTISITGFVFGAFSFFADYVVCFLIQNSRTVEYPEGDTPLTTLECFLFFAWGDWINSADIVMWALLCLEGTDLFGNKVKRTWMDYAVLIYVPVWFWLTPWISQNISQDDRLLLITRPSEKYIYYGILVIFIPLLHLERKLSFQSIRHVLFLGLGCGLVHHAPLFYWGMRGYQSITVLIVTILTEWPSIMCVIVFFVHRCSVDSSYPQISKREKSRRRSRHSIILSLFFVIAAIFIPNEFWLSININNMEIDKQFYKLLPYMSAQRFQQVGTALVWMMTCSKASSYFKTGDVDCYDNYDQLRVIATSAKGGSVLGTKLALVVGQACGQCVGSGQRHSDAWPPPVETVPDYPSDILLAIANMRDWPMYASAMNKTVQCVVVIRHPLSRLRSLYLYARNGGEKWFVDTGVEDRLDLPMHESVAQFISEFGKDYLILSHSYLLLNIAQGCHPIKYEELRVDFNNTMSTWLHHWGVKEEVTPSLIDLMQSENPLNVETLGTDHHVTTSKYSEPFIKYVNGAINAYDSGSIKALIDEQAVELQYSVVQET